MQGTCLGESHRASDAFMVDFAGTMMPMHYGSQIEEHMAVRHHAGIFDVSHMGVVAISGPDAAKLLSWVCANDMSLCQPGKLARYSCLLNDDAGILDDVIVYKRDATYYQMVVNAGRKHEDVAHLQQQATDLDVRVAWLDDYAIVACQGPKAIELVSQLRSNRWRNDLSLLKRFDCLWDQEYCIARTGYTGSDGVEIIFPSSDAKVLWQQCIDLGMQPCGLGARDSLRLEAGYLLYGSDMDSDTSPDQVNLSWTVGLDEQRDFIGKQRLLQRRETENRLLCALKAPPKQMMRPGQSVLASGETVGHITSACYSPLLKQFIAFAHVPASFEQLQVRGRRGDFSVEQVKAPFVALS